MSKLNSHFLQKLLNTTEQIIIGKKFSNTHMGSVNANTSEPRSLRFVGQATSTLSQSLIQVKDYGKGTVIEEKQINGPEDDTPIDHIKKRRISHFRIDIEGKNTTHPFE